MHDSATVNPFDSEPKIGLPAAAALIPSFRDGRPTNPSTVFRWLTEGVRLPGTKRRLRLEGCRIGGRWVTSQGAIQRFSQTLTEARLGESPEVAAPLSPSARRRASERANSELEKMGA